MKKIITSILILTLSIINAYCQQNPTEPKIGTLDGNQYICIDKDKPEIKVKIEVPTGYSKKIKRFIVEWNVSGGSVNSLEIPASLNPPVQTLQFNLSSFFGSCIDSVRGDITVYTDLEGEDMVNNGFKPTFRQKPRAKISDDSLSTCVGQSFTFDGSKSCPTNISEYEWTIEGKKYYGITYTHTFATPGEKLVKLKVTNICGFDEDSIKIIVRNLPVAVAEADAKLVSNKYTICLNDNDKGKILVDGSKSQFANQLEWSVLGSNSSYTEIKKHIPNPLFPLVEDPKKKDIIFKQIGIYEIVLKANMPCDFPDYDTVIVEVIDRVPVYLTPINDTCGPIMYSPPSNISGTEYFINNQKVTSFPRELKAGTYKIEAKYQNDCGPTQAEINFKVFEPINAKITSPTNGVVVCKDNNAKISLEGNHSGGVFSGDFVTKTGNNYHFTPSTTGTFTIRFTTGFGQCLRRDSIKIEVIDNIPLTITPQPDVCNSLSYTPGNYNSKAQYTINGNIEKNFPKTLSPGLYTVVGVLSNVCGNDQTVRDTFEVTVPQNVKILSPKNDTTVCMSNTSFELIGSAVKGEFSGSSLVSKDGNKWVFTPSQPGTYNLTYTEGIGACKTTATVKIQVIENQILTLLPQEDVCTSLTYSIQPNNIAGASYTLNGNPFTGSKKLEVGKYIVYGRYQDVCGIQEVRDTFEIKEVNQVKITAPLDGTTLCLNQSPIEIKTSEFGGVFTPSSHITESGGKYFFHPSKIEEVTLKYTYGDGIGCSTSDQIKISILGENPLNLVTQEDVCQQLSYTPNPYREEATYSINGTIENEFPIILNKEDRYIIEAKFSNACGEKIIKDTFFVTVPQEVKFTSHSKKATFCKSQGPIEIKVSVENGQFNTVKGFYSNNGKHFFDPAISDKGQYQLIYHQGIGDCNRSDTLNITVIESIPLTLPKHNDICYEIEFSPNGFSNDATYKINGEVIENSKFPLLLKDPKIYIVEAEMTNECGTLNLKDTFELFIPLNVSITSHSDSITLCVSNEKLKIIGSSDRGHFVPMNQLVSIQPHEAEFDVSQAGIYFVVFEQGFGDCYTSDTLIVSVENTKVLILDEQQDACEELEYTPQPLNEFAEYKINGVVVTSFPTKLSKGEYEIIATLVDVCETKIIYDTFEIFAQNDLKIKTTSAARVCVNSDRILLESSVTQATFVGDKLIQEDGKTYFVPDEPGFYKIYLELPLINCVLKDSIEFEVIGLAPKIEDEFICQEITSIILKGTPEGGVWTSSTCPSCVQGDKFIFDGIHQEYQYEYTLTNDIGCVATDIATINIISPKSDFYLSTAPCSSGIDFDLSNSVGQQYHWKIDGMDVDQPPFIGLSTGEHIITLIAQISHCYDTSDIAVFIIDPVTTAADFEIPLDEHCTPFQLQPVIYTPQYDYLDYQWVLDYNQEITEMNSYDLGSGIELINDSPFRKLAILTYRAGNVCGWVEKSDSIEIIGIPKSIIGIDSSRYGCSPYTIAMSNIAQGEMSECIWRVNGKEIRSCDPYIYQTFVANDTITKFPIELEVSNECGKSISHDTITVSPPWIDVFFNTDEYEVCPNTPVYFEDATTPEPIYWRWSFGDGQFSDEQNPTVVFKTPGLYQVTLKASTGCGYDSITRPVLVKEVPDVDFILPVYTCQNQISDSIINLSDYQNHKFIWDFGDGILDSTNAHPKHTFLEFGVTNVSLTMVDKETHCFASLTKPFEVKAQPQIDIVLDSLICYGKEVQVPNNTLYANDYTWYYDKVPVHSGKDALIIFKETGEHYIQLIATYNDKCVDSISKVVFVRRCDVYIPNVFTPNNDGKDDFFTAYGGVNTSMIRSIKIFDRWGELVFSKNDYPLNVEYLGWDGSVSTRSKSYGVNSAVFIYMIEVEFTDGSTEMFTGDVTLLR